MPRTKKIGHSKVKFNVSEKKRIICECLLCLCTKIVLFSAKTQNV